MKRFDVLRDGKVILKNQTMTRAVQNRLVLMVNAAQQTVTMRAVAVPPPPPPPVQVDPLELARNVCFFATVTDDAIQWFSRLPPSWKAAFTADPKYPVTNQEITAVKASHHRAYAWCDCHTTFPSSAKKMVAERKGADDKPLLDGWYGEAESAPAFAVAFDAGAPAVIGNLSAITDGQLARVAAGGPPLFIQETYYNVPGNVGAGGPDWRNANKGVGGNALAVYGSTTEGATYLPLREQIRRGYFNPDHDSLYCEGMLEDDWKALLEATS